MSARTVESRRTEPVGRRGQRAAGAGGGQARPHEALSLRLAAIKRRRRGHDPGRVIRDLAVMLAGGGECVSDLGAVRDQQALFGPVASDSTAFRVVDRIASEPDCLRRCARRRAGARAVLAAAWHARAADDRHRRDADHGASEKEGAAGNYKGGYGFHPLAAYADETREALGALLRPGNAGANTATDHITVLDRALEQVPAEHIESIEILVRADSAGATHALADYCRDARLRFSFGDELTESVRTAILEPPRMPGSRARPGRLGQGERPGRRDHRRRRPLLARRLPGDRAARAPAPRRAAELHRPRRLPLQAILTDQPDPDIAVGASPPPTRPGRGPHPRRQGHRPGQAPVKEQLNEVWLEIVLLAHDVIAWTQALLLDGELAKAEPKRRATGSARRRPPRLHGRRAKLHLQDTWPDSRRVAKLKALPAPA